MIQAVLTWAGEWMRYFAEWPVYAATIVAIGVFAFPELSAILAKFRSREGFAITPITGSGLTIKNAGHDTCRLAIRNRTGHMLERCSARLESIQDVMNGHVLPTFDGWRPTALEWSPEESLRGGPYSELLDLPSDDQDHFVDVALVKYSALADLEFMAADDRRRRIEGQGEYKLVVVVTSHSAIPHTTRREFLLRYRNRGKDTEMPGPIELREWEDGMETRLLEDLTPVSPVPTAEPLQLAIGPTEPDGEGTEFINGSVTNPNPFLVEGAYVSVKSYQPSTSGIAGPFPSEGFKFPQSTHEGTGDTFQLPGHTTRHVTLAFRKKGADVFFTPHTPHDLTTRKLEGWWELPTGPYYQIEVEIGSERTEIPLGNATLRIWTAGFYGELVPLG